MGALCSAPCGTVRSKGDFDEETCNESPNVTPVCEVVVFPSVVPLVRSLTTEPPPPTQEEKKKSNKNLKQEEKVWKDTTLLKIRTKDIVVSGTLGSGMCSSVSKGKYNDQFVAVKKINGAINTTKLLNHARTLHSLQSQHNLQLIGITSNPHKLVFEYMDVGSLSKYLSAKRMKKKQTPKLSTVTIAVAIAKGLQDLHNHNIVHGELNSRNVLLSSDGCVKLADCGFARLTMESTTCPNKCAVGATKRQKHRYVASDCFWTAPEILAGKALSCQSDIYSFGVILAELDTLELPYASHDVPYIQLINEIQHGKRVPSFSVNCQMWYHTLAMKCLAFNPQERPTVMEILRLMLISYPSLPFIAQVNMPNPSQSISIDVTCKRSLCKISYVVHVNSNTTSWTIHRSYKDFAILRQAMLHLAKCDEAIHESLTMLPFPPKHLHVLPGQRLKLACFMEQSLALCMNDANIMKLLKHFLDFEVAPAVDSKPIANSTHSEYASMRILSLSELYNDDDVSDIAFELSIYGLDATDICLLLEILVRTVAKARLGVDGAYSIVDGRFVLNKVAYVHEVLLLSESSAVQSLLHDTVPRCLEVFALHAWQHD